MSGLAIGMPYLIDISSARRGLAAVTAIANDLLSFRGLSELHSADAYLNRSS
jgi:hypothetical protein